MIHIKSPEEIELMRISARLVSQTLTEVASRCLSPVSLPITSIRRSERSSAATDAIPSFLGFHGYPFNSCTSVNDVVVHGFPNKSELRDGDIISVDIGVYKNGFPR